MHTFERLDAEPSHARCEHAGQHHDTDNACWLMAASRSTAGRTLAALVRLRTKPPEIMPRAHAQRMASLKTKQGRVAFSKQVCCRYYRQRARRCQISIRS